jgi:hypothetical protein
MNDHAATRLRESFVADLLAKGSTGSLCDWRSAPAQFPSRSVLDWRLMPYNRTEALAEPSVDAPQAPIARRASGWFSGASGPHLVERWRVALGRKYVRRASHSVVTILEVMSAPTSGATGAG